MIYKMTLKDSADEMTFDLLEVPIVDKDIEGAVDNVTLDGNQYTDYLWLKKQFIQKWSILCDDEYTRLRGFYTRQFEGAEVPSYRLYYGDDIIRNSTLSGERIELSISGVADGTMSLTQMDGNIEQTTYTGKNLWGGFANDFSKSSSGITFVTKTDGTITNTAGTTSATAYSAFASEATNNGLTKTLEAGTYCISGASGNITLDVCDTSGATLVTDSGNGATFTLSAQKTVFVRIRVASGKTLTADTTKPLLESGNQPTAYEPYVGGQPSPSPSYPQNIYTVTGRQTVGTVGKNLYDPNSTVFSVPANVSVEVEGNSVKVTALITTTSSNLYWRTPIPDSMLEDGKTYTISSVLGSGAYRSLRLLLRNHDGSNAGFSTGFSVTYDSRYTLFVVENPFATSGATQVTAGTTCTISNIQVEEGSTATTFEPYNGQGHEINLGKNLFDKDNANILQAGITTTKIESATANRTLWIPCEPSTTYTVQKRNDGDTNRFNVATTAVTPAIDVAITNRIENPNASSITYTTSANAKYLCVQYFRTAETTLTEQQVLDSIQIEKGSTASPYSAYFEPIELCKIGTYQDRIYKENGKWWLHKEIGKVVFDGSENWSLINAGSSNFYYNLPVFVTPKDQDIMPVSNYFVGTPITNGNTSVGLWITNAGTIRARKETEQTLAGYKTWLGTALPSVYYVLATPTTTEITNEEVLGGLEALQNEAISVGQHNIYTDTPNALPTLTFDLTEYLSKSTTIIPETAVRLTLTDGGVINACGCRKDVQLTMRETIE